MTGITREMVSQNLNKLVDTKRMDIEEARYSLNFDLQTFKRMKSNSLKSAVEKKTPSLALHRKYWTATHTAVLVIWSIVHYTRKFSVGKGMDDESAELLAEFILDDYYFMTLADIKAAFSMAIKGEFGKIYDRVDAQVVLGWFKEYSERKMNYVEDKRIIEHSKEKHNKKQAKMQIPESLVNLKKELESKWEKEKPVFQQFVSIEEFCQTKGFDYDAVQGELRYHHELLKQNLIDISSKSFPSLKTHENALLKILNRGEVPKWLEKYKK